jgi:hypothetical protein
MTCFSEILDNTSQVISDLSIFSDQFALCFFTDGYPVVSNYTKEVNNIYNAIAKISNKLTSSLLVGYGDYYNKSLMSEMAEKLGGSLTHSSSLPSFSIALDAFLDISETAKKVPIQIAEEITKDTLIYSISGCNVNLYTPNENNEVFISASTPDISVYVLTDKNPNKFSNKDLTETFNKGLYAGSYILTQRCKTDTAIDLLALTGDKCLIDGVTNSYTNAEYGKAEKSIQDAINDPSKRFLDGQVFDYVPPVDAFCLLDLIDLLNGDKNAYFYPRHKNFEYKKIGRPSKPLEGFAEFKADPNTRSPFSDLVWNETKINLSLRALIRGTVGLGDEAAKYGLLDTYPTYQFRNYTFVKDGILNVTRLPISFSEELFKILIQKGVIELENPIDRLLWEKDKVYTLNLDAIPIVNRKIAGANLSAKDLCDKVIEEHTYKGIIKTLKWYKATHYPEKEVTADTATTWMEKQQAFLEGKGLNTKTGAFEPKMETVESVDFYMAKEFDIKIKGLSSLPKVEAVLEKLKANKKLTASDKLITAGINLVEGKSGVWDTIMEAWLDKMILEYQGKLKEVRRKIQETKFGILLGKMWFSDFTSREENKLTVGDYEITISLTEKKVAI